MAEARHSVGVVAARRALAGPWADHQWMPVAVLPAVPEVAPGTPLGTSGADQTFYAGAAEISLHSGETAHYRDNLESGRPSLWVALNVDAADRVEIVRVTADPYEGEALAGSVGDVVEAVAMPAQVREWVAEFFAANHVERAFFKRKRDRHGREPRRATRGGAGNAEDDG
jgi:hypothetical protein